MADGLNDFRTQRVADLLADFRNLQHYIAAAQVDPPNTDDYYTEGWAVLRQCNLDGQQILNAAADTQVARGQTAEEQNKAELQKIMLDAFCRRHEAQKIYERQGAAQNWITWRENVLRGQRPQPAHAAQLAACDRQLRQELAALTDEIIYSDLRSSDCRMGRWTQEDSSLRHVQRWLRARR